VADSPYFQSANTAIDADKKALLEAVAGAGTAGAQAYQQSQAAINQAKQDALGRAAQRAVTLGAGGNDQTFGGAYDSRLGQLNTNNQSFQQGLQSMSAANQGYLENARSAIPTLSAINTNKATAQEATIKAAIAAARQKAQDAADAAALARQDKLNAEDRADARASRRDDRADARAAAKEAAKATKPLTRDQLFGKVQATEDVQNNATPGASMIETNPNLSDILMGAMDTYAYNKNKGQSTTPEFELAKALGEYYGMTPDQVYAAIPPAKLASYMSGETKVDKTLTSMSDPEKAAYADSLAKKYASKGVTTTLAKSVVNNVDFQHDVNWILGGADGKTQGEVEDLLRKYYLVDRKWPSEYNVLVGEYLSRLPKG
jgi:hypothetical protein